MLFCVEFNTTGLDIYTTVVALLVIVTFGVLTCAGTGAGAGVGGFYTIGAGAGATGVLLAIVVFEVVADFPPHPFFSALDGEACGTKLFATFPD